MPFPAGGVVLGSVGSALDRAWAANLDLLFGRVFLFLPTVGLGSLEPIYNDLVGLTQSSSESNSAWIFPACICRVPSCRMEMVSVMVGWWLINHSRHSLRSSVKTVICRVACSSTNLRLVLASGVVDHFPRSPGYDPPRICK